MFSNSSFYWSCLFIFLGFQLNAQKSLDGGYCPDIDYISEYTEYYKFFDDSTFLYVLIDDTGDHYGKGTFSILKDSLILNYKDLSTSVTHPQFTIDTLEGNQSQISVVNTLDSSLNYQLSCVIYEHDKIVQRVNSSKNNILFIKLQTQQRAVVTGFLEDDKNVFIPFLQFDVHGKNQAQKIIYSTSGINLYKGSYKSHRKAYRIKIKKKHFLLKTYNGWQKYKIC